MKAVEGLPWFATMIQRQKLAKFISKAELWMTVMMQTLSVYKEAFRLLSTSKIAAIGMDKSIQAQSSSKWRFPSG